MIRSNHYRSISNAFAAATLLMTASLSAQAFDTPGKMGPPIPWSTFSTSEVTAPAGKHIKQLNFRHSGTSIWGMRMILSDVTRSTVSYKPWMGVQADSKTIFRIPKYDYLSRMTFYWDPIEFKINGVKAETDGGKSSLIGSDSGVVTVAEFPEHEIVGFGYDGVSGLHLRGVWVKFRPAWQATVGPFGTAGNVRSRQIPTGNFVSNFIADFTTGTRPGMKGIRLKYSDRTLEEVGMTGGLGSVGTSGGWGLGSGRVVSATVWADSNRVRGLKLKKSTGHSFSFGVETGTSYEVENIENHEVVGVFGTTSNSRVTALGFIFRPLLGHQSVGTTEGCAASSGVVPTISVDADEVIALDNEDLAIDLSDAPASASAVLMVSDGPGLSSSTGCTLMQGSEVVASFTTSATGTGSASITMPDFSELIGSDLNAQYVVYDGTTSASRRLSLWVGLQ